VTAGLSDQLLGMAADAGLTGGGPLLVVLDFGALTFFDSSGLGVVVQLWKTLRASGGDLAVARPPQICALLMMRTGVAQHIVMDDTVAGAAARLAAGHDAVERPRAAEAG
jgi:anti-anti-sigma factor